VKAGGVVRTVDALARYTVTTVAVSVAETLAT